MTTSQLLTEIQLRFEVRVNISIANIFLLAYRHSVAWLTVRIRLRNSCICEKIARRLQAMQQNIDMTICIYACGCLMFGFLGDFIFIFFSRRQIGKT